MNRLTEILQASASLLRDALPDEPLPLKVEELVEAISSKAGSIQAWQHPLGFHHFELTPLLDIPEGDRLRLHVWTIETLAKRDELGAIHDHAWDLKSAVLLGQLTDVVLVPFEENDGEFRLLRVDYRGDGTFVHDEERRVRMEEGPRRTVRAGSCYQLKAGSFHVTEVDEMPTATLVLGRYPQDRPAYIASRREFPGSRLVERQFLPLSTAANTLKSIIRVARRSS